MTKQKRQPQIKDLQAEIKACIAKRRYAQKKHAIQRQLERKIELDDVLYVLQNGYHEKSKTTFDEQFCAWKYAIRGKTLDDFDIRIIIGFHENEMFIITVMHVTKDKKP